MKNKVVILGANGFIGSFLKNYLIREDREIISVTRTDLDLTNYQDVYTWLMRKRPNIIINCAGSIPKIGYVHGAGQIDVSVERNNMNIFLSFFRNSDLFDKFINIGSGAEFDKSRDITNVNEHNIFNIYPEDSYGYSKNIISRLCYEKDNFYTLRLFSIYHHTEPAFRLFKNLMKHHIDFFSVMNRYQDFISMRDFSKIVDYYIDNNSFFRDINCVYKDKVKIEYLVDKFCDMANLPKDRIGYHVNPDINYTGNGDKLSNLKIEFEGHDLGLQEYVNSIYA